MALAPRKKLWSSPIEVIDKAIECLKLTEVDIIIDLGAGDGKFMLRVIESTPASVIGIEVDENRVSSIQNIIADQNISSSRCHIILGNALEADLSQATALYLYLVPRGLRLVLPLIKQIKRDNIRVATYMSALPGVEPVEVHKVSTVAHPEAQWPLYIYVFNNLTSS